MLALIVDDDEYNRELLRRMLSHLGWLCDEAAGGRAAIDACGSVHYNLILLDLHMPDMGGEEAARRIRVLPPPFVQDSDHWARPYIVAVTGADASGLVSPDCFDAFLAKPFVLSELKAILPCGT